MDTVKLTIIGAGSSSFCPATVADILLSEKFARVNVNLTLMDISEAALANGVAFARRAAVQTKRPVAIQATTHLREAVYGADIVVTAIEKARYHYWSQDFHVPRRYGFRQIYGENGGPGGMFHFLRNVGPMLEIARAMEQECPDAWLLNYSNPEAKLVEAISKLTRVKVVGLCHGEQMGVDQLAKFLEVPREDLETEICGLNHFGWFTRIKSCRTGADLYPLLRQKEKEADWLSDWDEYALSRILFRVFGLWPYPGANHIGEYIAWSDSFLASALLQYFYDPAAESVWQDGKTPEFVYSLAQNPTARNLYPTAEATDRQDSAEQAIYPSHEYGIAIAEAICFDEPVRIGAVNRPNQLQAPGVLPGMAVETPATVDGGGVHPAATVALPTAILAMINQQGAIHELLIQAYRERSRKKLLQALLIDPTISTYNNAVALINELFRLQADILPEMSW